MNWHDLLVRCSALQMYLLITPVDEDRSIEMTLFDTKGKDKETQTFPPDASPRVLWQVADEWVTWHTLSEKRRRLRNAARKESIDDWVPRSRMQWIGGIVLLVLTAALFAVGGYLLFDAQRAERAAAAGDILIAAAGWRGWADMMMQSILIGGAIALIVMVIHLGVSDK